MVGVILHVLLEYLILDRFHVLWSQFECWVPSMLWLLSDLDHVFQVVVSVDVRTGQRSNHGVLHRPCLDSWVVLTIVMLAAMLLSLCPTCLGTWQSFLLEGLAAMAFIALTLCCVVSTHFDMG